jgi:hypothetical protein
MEINRNTEIRKHQDIMEEVKNRINFDDMLEVLMGNIPKNLDDPINSSKRFGLKDIDVIRNHARSNGISSIPIFFDEFVTMTLGSSRPTIGNLHHVLISCGFFRAADYLADKMGIPRHERPHSGPAKKVDISLPGEFNELQLPSVPSDPIGVNIDRRKSSPVSPKIELTRSTNQTYENGTNQPNTPDLKPPTQNLPILSQKEMSDLIKFSKSKENSEPIDGEIPLLSIFHNGKTETSIKSTHPELPALSEILGKEPTPSTSKAVEGFNPILVQQFENNQPSLNLPAFDRLEISDNNLPGPSSIKINVDYNDSQSSSSSSVEDD